MASLIGIDWGTTTFRAYLFDQSRECIGKVATAAGIMQENSPDFEAILRAQVGDWLVRYPDIPIIASGMITSKQGWIETPYLSCPASLKDLSANLKKHRLKDGRKMHFVSGVCQLQPTANIMRGEETQMAGLASKEPMLAILPGTHSKWIWMEEEYISRFSTFMTGELFTAITKHTILGRLMTEEQNPESFHLGVQEGFSTSPESGGILSQLFSARAKPILDLMSPSSIKDYISGLLLGTEIKEAVSIGFQSGLQPLICGSSNLANLYHSALRICGFNPTVAEADTASTGLLRIAGEAELI